MFAQSHQPITGTILVVDDQASNRELLEELLTVEGFSVLTASDGTEALERLSTAPIDLVILDVMMPHLSGFATCEKINSSSSS